MRSLVSSACVFLALCFFATRANAGDHYVCGLNHAGMSLEQWASANGNRARFATAPRSDRETLTELQEASGTAFGPDERTDLGFPPVIWLIQDASNAFAGRSAEGPNERSVQILLDDSWLRGLEEQLSNTWVRPTVIAHELG